MCEREDEGEADAAAGEEVLEWRVLAGEVGVVDVDEAEDGDAEAGDGAVEDGEVDDGLEGDAGQGTEGVANEGPVLRGGEEHEDLGGGRSTIQCQLLFIPLNRGFTLQGLDKRLCECCRISHTEVVSNSRNKIGHEFCKFKTGFTE